MRRRLAHTHIRLILTVGGLVGVLLLFFLVTVRPDPFFNPEHVPKVITANFIDLSRVYEISKYRSGAGHDYALNGEVCRSMKHYFNHSHDYDPTTHVPLRSQPTLADPNIPIYAPFNGIILSVGSENTPIGKQVSIVSWAHPFYTARLFHIDLLPGLHALSTVRSGQQIATIGPRDGTDFALEVNGAGIGGRGVSYFQAMTDRAFAPYAALGYTRDDFILSKAYRDAHPLQCLHTQSDAFVPSPGYDPSQDYVKLRPDPYERAKGPQMGPR